MQITYYGHSCFVADSGKHKILFDPFITGNAKASRVDPNGIACDFILVSHAHGDHTGDLLDIAKRTNALVVASYEITTWCEKHGYNNTHGLNTGGFIDLPFGKLRVVAAQHSSSFPDGTYGGNPLGFIVEANNRTFYYSGDTALTLDMQLIPRWHALDFCLMPVGNNFTMGYEDACTAAEFVNCKTVIGLHYDTFPPITIDRQAAKEHFKRDGRELILMDIGQTLSL